MRKLTLYERNALMTLNERGSVIIEPGASREDAIVEQMLNSLVRKKRARVEPTDAGPRYWPLTND